jgi:hypothetical protein
MTDSVTAGHESAMPQWARELRAATETALLDGLGEQQLERLRERSRNLATVELVAYLRAETDRVLADEPTS